MIRTVGGLVTATCLVVTSAAVLASPRDGQTEARAQLLREAEQALSVGPFSVMQKARVAPSGDKHDFLTLAPYWWPDPTKPGGLPYIRRDGETNPESKRETDDRPFGQMISAVSTLANAYRDTQDERFAARAALLLRTWFLDAASRMNPNLDYGQAIPGRNTGRGAGLITMRYLVRVVDAARLLVASSSWTESDRKALHAWCESFAKWLQTSKIGREEAMADNNHGTWYDAQLTALLLYTGHPEQAKKRLEIAKKKLASQIDRDGRQPRELERTQAWHYSVFNLDAWFTLARLGTEVDVDLWNFRTSDGRSLRSALDYLVPFAGAAKPWPHPQITPFEWDVFARLLDQAAMVWKNDEYRALAQRVRGTH